MFVIIGATGTIGREVVTQLRGTGAAVTAVTRDPGQAQMPTGTVVVGADPSVPSIPTETWDGVEGVLLSSAP